MNEEDSFVILGSSPLNSLCPHGDSLLHDALDGAVENGTLAEDGIDVNKVAEEALSNSSMTQSKQCSLPTTLPLEGKSLAASFLMGDVTADVLKNSVYSQFPSLCSMEACAEDVVKLQTMMTEYLALKRTLDKVNHTMQEYYKITQQWRAEAAAQESEYKLKLQECQSQIENLSEENRKLKKEVDTNLEQIRLVEDIRQKEHDELRQELSEKSSLINNMRVEIDKLQQHQVPSFEYVPDESCQKSDIEYVKREEHDKQITDLRRQLSEMLAENLEINDMKKTYVDEINCLKVNLVSTEELLKATRADVNQLKAKNLQSDEEIAHLRNQVDIYRKDFEMERADRENNASEKEKYLMDLRTLQVRNQELIEALADAHKNSRSISTSTTSSTASGSSTKLREEQRPVRVLDPTGAAAKTAEGLLRCPICSKSFNALTVLQSHVNDCLDKN